MKQKSVAILICLIFAALLTGCFGRSEVSEAPSAPLRSPHPTFTPTPPSQPTPAAPEAAPVAPEAAPAQADAPPAPVEAQPIAQDAAPANNEAPASPATQTVLGVVNDDLINIRRGPGLQYPPIKLGMRGDEFTITGRSEDNLWWQICCIEELPAWISQTYVDTDGPVDAIPVADPDATAQDQVVIAPTPVPADENQNPPAEQNAPAPPAETAPQEAEAPTEPPAPAFPFTLAAQEQFPENNNLVRIFLYVYQGEEALPGYTLRVSRDGAALPVNGVSSDAAGMTWPTASPRQRFQNLKVEFPGANPAGVWEVQLIDGSGAAVGPAATFNLSATDANRELYVRYEKQ